MIKYISTVFIVGLWINISEFVRNEILIRNIWTDGYASIGLVFPSSTVNSIIWIIWCFIIAAGVVYLSTRFYVIKTTLIIWLLCFVLFWLSMFNLGVLPEGLLYWDIPWSFIEVYIASLISYKLMTKYKMVKK